MKLEHIQARNRRIRARKRGSAVIGVVVATLLVGCLALGLFILATSQRAPTADVPVSTHPVALEGLQEAVENEALRLGN